jgi:predicted amidohydrolase
VSGAAVLAVGQLQILEGEVAINARRCHRAIEDAAAADADVLVLPECALTGYQFATRDEAWAASITAGDPRLRALGDAAAQLSMTVVVGFLERTGDVLCNTAAVLGADGCSTLIRKTHIPVLAADRFVTPGERIGPVIATPFGRLGVAICYDFRFPEVCRSLALMGAEVIAVPVNWSSVVTVVAEHFVPVRAVENRVFVAVADRAGTTGGTSFLGASRVVGPDGTALTALLDGCREHAVAVAAVDLELARTKATVFDPGVFEIDVFAHRRPDLYGSFGLDPED